jgi:hypothetical protein
LHAGQSYHMDDIAMSRNNRVVNRLFYHTHPFVT